MFLDRRVSMIFVVFELLVAVSGSGTYLKSFLDVFRFVLTHYGAKRSHGDPIQVNLYVLLLVRALCNLPM